MTHQRRGSKVVIIPPDPEEESTDASSPNLFLKSQFYRQFLLRSQGRIRIPETLIKARGSPAVFLSNLPSCILTETDYNALDSFAAACRSVRFCQDCTRPCPYRLPAFIAFFRCEVKLLFSESDLRAVASTSPEYLIQRYIPSNQYKAAKIRIKLTSTGISSERVICKKSPYPFNSLLGANRRQKQTASRRGSFVIQDNEVRLEQEITQLLRFPRLMSPSKTPSPRRPSFTLKSSASFGLLAGGVVDMGKNPYLVSFERPMETVNECQSLLGMDVFVQQFRRSFELICENLGLIATSMEFDLIFGSDGLWYFLDMKDYTVESLEDRIKTRLLDLGHESESSVHHGTPLERTLGRLKSFFLSNKPLTPLKAPYITKESLRDSRGNLYQNFSKSVDLS